MLVTDIPCWVGTTVSPRLVLPLVTYRLPRTLSPPMLEHTFGDDQAIQKENVLVDVASDFPSCSWSGREAESGRS